jgi:hypothetical protein
MLTPYVTDELFNTLSRYSNQKKRLIERLKEFILHKQQYPCNGGVPGQCPGFGSTDKKFKSSGNFGKEIRGVAHAHLTDDISIAYLVDGDNLNLYGVYSHDAMGTGQPANINRQQQIADQWAKMSFSQPLDANALGEPKKDVSEPKAKPAGTKPDFTPKAKVAPQAAKPADNSVVALAQKVDAHWPQRGLLNKLAGSQTKQQAVAILNNEAQNIANLRDRGAKLYPNQMDYFKGLASLYAHYEKQR